MQMHKLNQSMNFFMITPENWSALDNVKYFLRSNKVGFPTYVLDIDRYGDEHSVVKRYQGFVGEIYPGHPEMLGLPTHIIINKQRKVLFAATGANKFSAAVLDSVMRANR